MTIGLAICTYKRPDGLRRILAALPEGLADCGNVPVIVIDNDGSDPAIAQIAEEAPVPVIYEVEAQPGISAARNRALDVAARLGLKRLAMLDDDEWPAPGWLAAMRGRMDETGAGVVSGVVEPVFPEGSGLERYGQFWAVRPQERDGRAFVHATSAVLMELSALGGARFEEAYGLSGGGDLVFFGKLFEQGVSMAWAEDALVFEEVPQKRASLEWLKGRKHRVGNHMVMEEVVRQGAFKPMLKTLVLFARFAIYPVLGREPGAVMLGWRLEWHKLIGRVAGHRGTRVFEYGRDGVRTRRVGG